MRHERGRVDDRQRRAVYLGERRCVFSHTLRTDQEMAPSGSCPPAAGFARRAAWMVVARRLLDAVVAET
jgi:hypothetical protein